MPEVSRFFGIVIRLFHGNHHPPHFHATYEEHEALVEINTLAVYRGWLPRRALALVLEWAAQRRGELRAAWTLCQQGKPPGRIEPLE